MANSREIWLVRHGETPWSLSHQHTSRTDILLTKKGRQQAKNLRSILAKEDFNQVLTSPMTRAKETCRLAGKTNQAITNNLLKEWDYGIYEGHTTTEIQKEIPEWTIWDHPVIGGESLTTVEDRARKIIEICQIIKGKSLLFSHAHILRVLAGYWISGCGTTGRHFVLDPASISILGYERQTRVIHSWNLTPY